MEGKFIVFEALDASGKTTQTDALVANLEKAGITVWKTRECTSGPIGKLIKSDYLSGVRECDEHVINILMAADRLEHITSPDGILSHLEKGEWVVCDRFVLSALAYDNYEYTSIEDINSGFEYTYNMNKLSIEKVSPDMTIYLDVPVSECVKRIAERNEKQEVFETEAKLELIRKSYEKARIFLENKKYNMNVTTIDGNRKPKDVSDEIFKVVKKQLL